MKQADMGSAFPVQKNPDGSWPHASGDQGMSLRDWFAGQALTGLLAAQIHGHNEWPGVFPGLAYEAADAMLTTRGGTDDDER